MLTLKDLKTGMRVRTAEKGDFYVVVDWTHQLKEKTECTGLLLRTSNNNETPWLFHGLLGYNQDLTFPDNPEWDIVGVFIYTNNVLDEMDNPGYLEYWKEITEPVHYDQNALAKYFAKFS